MKKQLFGYLLAGLLLITIPSFGQQKNYHTKTINGIEYYQYTIEVSEGLFAIARKFEVSPDDIAKANPEIKDGLKVGQQILIPTPKKNKVHNASKNDSKLEFIEHTVEKKQTIFAISHKYDVSQEDLIKYNPELENGLREGMALRIPKQTKVEKTVDKVVSEKAENNSAKSSKDKNTVNHIVQQDETLYSISRKYKVEVADIIELNPNSATTLSVGTELKIPAKGNVEIVQKKTSATTTSAQNYDVNNLFDASLLTKSTNKNKVMRIAFLLPFMLDQDKKDASVDRFTDFYSGALLAIKEAKQKGISFEVYCYDTEKTEEKLQEVLQNSELKTMNLIIGPAFSNQVSIIGEFAKENRINTLIPFTSKVSDIDTNPYLFQFNPGSDMELNYAADLFTGKYKKMNIVFAEVPGVSSMDEGRIWANDLKKELKKSNKSFSTIELTTSDLADFSGVFKSDEKNLVIFNTDKFAYISPFIAPLRAASTQFSVVLFEQYNWRNQQEKLPKGMCLSAFTQTISSDKLSQYNSEYAYYFGKPMSKESPRFDLLGYDLSLYFIELFQKFGNKFTNKIGSYNFVNGLQSKPAFERISNGSGFVNKRIYLIED